MDWRVRDKGSASEAAFREAITSELKLPCPQCLAGSLRSRRSPWCHSGWRKAPDTRSGDREFALSLGGRAQFRFFQSAERKEDTAGLLLEEIGPGMEELAPVEVFLPGNPADSVPVTLETLVTETGILELWFVARDGRRWKLEFNVRPKSQRAS